MHIAGCLILLSWSAQARRPSHAGRRSQAHRPDLPGKPSPHQKGRATIVFYLHTHLSLIVEFNVRLWVSIFECRFKYLIVDFNI